MHRVTSLAQLAGARASDRARCGVMKKTWPAPERNTEPILEVLRRVLPRAGRVLEVASGSGQHVMHFARHLPHLEFQPTDIDDDNLASIRAWRHDEKLANV